MPDSGRARYRGASPRTRLSPEHLAVLFSLPPGILGTFFFLKVTGLANDIFAQIALIRVVGLLGKNAVLVVEYALQRQRQGLSIAERMRLRPILMTSFAFVMGVVPLRLAHAPVLWPAVP